MNRPYEFDDDKFAKILKKARKDAGYTMNEVMEEIGIGSQSTFKCYESGVYIPRADRFLMMCLSYGLSLEDFDDCISFPK